MTLIRMYLQIMGKRASSSVDNGPQLKHIKNLLSNYVHAAMPE